MTRIRMSLTDLLEGTAMCAERRETIRTEHVDDEATVTFVGLTLARLTFLKWLVRRRIVNEGCSDA